MIKNWLKICKVITYVGIIVSWILIMFSIWYPHCVILQRLFLTTFVITSTAWYIVHVGGD